MNLDLAGKVIVVTGGAKGIGEGIVFALARERAIPVIVGRGEKDNLEIVRKLHQLGHTAYQVVAELSSETECKNAVNAILDSTGQIDGLVNNAGVNDGVSLAGGTYQKFIDSLHKNLIHYYLMAHYSLKELIRNKGAVVNISSKTAETGQGNTSGYAAANGGRNALTREWAVELLPFGIRVNAVIVSECYTPLYESWINTFPDPQQKLRTITEKIPFGKRMTTAEEIANMVVFLLSQRSGHTTGQLIYVDGGYVHLDRAIT